MVRTPYLTYLGTRSMAGEDNMYGDMPVRMDNQPSRKVLPPHKHNCDLCLIKKIRRKNGKKRKSKSRKTSKSLPSL